MSASDSASNSGATPAGRNSRSIRLHSTWRGFLSGIFGGLLLTGAGLYSTLQTGGAVGSLVLLGVGLVVAVVVLFDLPVSSTFDATGVQRRPLLRRHRLEWSQVDQLTRTRPGIAARALRPGGLVAKVGRRRYLLVDQCESFDEHAALSKILGSTADDLLFEDVIVPAQDSAPTWVYRRKRWSDVDGEAS